HQLCLGTRLCEAEGPARATATCARGSPSRPAGGSAGCGRRTCRGRGRGGGDGGRSPPPPSRRTSAPFRDSSRASPPRGRYRCGCPPPRERWRGPAVPAPSGPRSSSSPPRCRLLFVLFDRRTQLGLSCVRPSPRKSREVKPIQVHHLVPSSHEVAHKRC